MRFSRALGGVYVFLMALFSTPLWAQPTQPNAETSAMTDRARALFTDGTKALDQGHWGEAHAAFVAAWSLKRHYQIAGNLGAAEVQIGRFREAAEHLSFYIREAPKEKVKERQKAQELLAQARKHIGALRIKVEPAGAEVLVDGESVGKAPLGEEVFVHPGSRVIDAKLDGYATARQVVEAVNGASQSVTLTLAQVPQAAPPPGSLGSVPVTSTQPAMKTPVETRDGVGSSSGVRPLVIGGLVATGVATVAGITFAIVSTSHGTDGDQQAKALLQDAGPRACAMPSLVARCAENESSLAARDAFADLSAWSFVAGGVIGAATALYVLTTSRPRSANTVRAVPVTLATGGGLVISGEW